METIEDRLSRIENRNKVNFFEIEKRLSAIESAKPDIEVNDINERMHELEDLILLLQVEISKLKDRLSGGPGIELPDLSEIEHKLDRLEGKISQSPSDALATEISVPDINERLNSIEHEIELLKESPVEINLEKPRHDINQNINQDISRRLDSIEQEFESMKSLEELLVRLEDRMSELAASRPETSVVEMEERLSSRLENKIRDIENRPKESSLPNDTERRLEYIENELKNLNDVKETIEREAANTASLEKRLMDVGNAPAVSSNSIENLRSAIENQKAIIEDINKNIEMKSVKFLTRQLEEFAKIMDKKIEGMEAPRLDSRLHVLEQKIEKLSTAIRSLISTMPVVVE
jgi:chromosome segregation ATPase